MVVRVAWALAMLLAIGGSMASPAAGSKFIPCHSGGILAHEFVSGGTLKTDLPDGPPTQVVVARDNTFNLYYEDVIDDTNFGFDDPSTPDGFFETRRDVYNLYPLLVHARLFGSSYLGSVDGTIGRLGY